MPYFPLFLDLHVKFKLSQDETTERHDTIKITKIEKHLYDIHLGYLKVDHYYRVHFKLEVCLSERERERKKDRGFIFIYF